MFNPSSYPHGKAIFLAAGLALVAPVNGNAQTSYEHAATRELVQLVDDAAEQIRGKGDAAFRDFETPGSRWRQAETYIFVLDPAGKMLVHPDGSLQGKNQLELKDVNGKPIIRGLLAAALTPGKPAGWYHYQWPVPGGLLPRWKSSYVRLMQAPGGASYVVGSGMYNDQMERAFVVDMVKNAVAEVEQRGKSAYPLFRDPKSPYIFKDAYIFVVGMDGVDLVNPAFPNLEGRNIRDVKDTQGKQPIREMIQVAQAKGLGWVDYLWPKPGESASTKKSAFVMRARIGDQDVLVGAGVYLAAAPKAVAKTKKISAPELMKLVRDASSELERRGEKAFPDFRKKGSKWFRDDTYLFVWSLEGVRVFHAALPASEGEDVRNLKDVIGRPIGEMFLAAATSPAGEGWAHYLWPEPGNLFPIWKSSFLKKVTFPSGKPYLVGSGIYNMEMNRAFIEDVVDRAAQLVAARGQEAFDELRDKTGPFVFMDTYVFVNNPEGVELVNPAHPSLEGTDLSRVKDLKGKFLVREYIDAALKKGSAWVDYYWYKPGENTPAQKHSFVRKVQHGAETYIVGAGFYAESVTKRQVGHLR